VEKDKSIVNGELAVNAMDKGWQDAMPVAFYSKLR
jgi:hypothetical protein